MMRQQSALQMANIITTWKEKGIGEIKRMANITCIIKGFLIIPIFNKTTCKPSIINLKIKTTNEKDNCLSIPSGHFIV